jgi:hypothetical protein
MEDSTGRNRPILMVATTSRLASGLGGERGEGRRKKGGRNTFARVKKSCQRGGVISRVGGFSVTDVHVRSFWLAGSLVPPTLVRLPPRDITSYDKPCSCVTLFMNRVNVLGAMQFKILPMILA